MATSTKATKVASKTTAGKAAPVKKAKSGSPAVSKTAKKADNKKAPVKKAANVKAKGTVTKSLKKTTASKLSTSKKAAPAKKTVAKNATRQTVKKPVVQKSAKNQAAKKAAPAPRHATKKENTMAKKEAIDKKTTTKKTAASKVDAPAKKTAPVNHHQKELKKAVAKVRAEKEAEKKTPKEFVMPKIKTEKARKYEPDFTKSILDQSPAENTGPSLRYSDSELTEFRDLITRKLETAKKELGYLQGLITRKDQMGGDESDNRYMTMEDGSLSMEREQLSQMASRQITFIDHLEKAMMRIENKTYGICRVTGKLIDKARLRAVPHATLSIEAKMGNVK